MNDVNEIFEKAKRDGFVNIYLDTPPEIMNMVKAYNEEMGECRVNRKRMKNFEAGFLAVNPIITIIFYLAALLSGHEIMLSSILTVAFLAVYFVFTMMKKNYIVVTIASAFMMIIDLRLGVLLLVNLFMLYMHMSIDSELKTHDGYIAFNDIRIINTGEVSSDRDGE